MATVAAPDDVVRRRFDVRGIVQGVGFRPFVYRLARELALAGWVRNDAAGVTIEVEGDAARIDAPRRGACATTRRRSRASTRIAVRDCAPRRATPASRSSKAAAAARRPRSGPTARSAPTASRELFDPARPALSLRVHQLHATAARATRSRARCPTTARRPAWPRFAQCPACARRVPRAARPPLPRRAERLSAPAARGSRLLDARRQRRSRDVDPIAATRRAPARAARSSRSRAWAASISPATRATPSAVARLRAAQGARGEAVRGDGRRTSRRCRRCADVDAGGARAARVARAADRAAAQARRAPTTRLPASRRASRGSA